MRRNAVNRTRRAVVAATAGLATLATVLAPAARAGEEPPALPPVQAEGLGAPTATDVWGGDTSVTLTATGWFHAEQHQGRWWLVTPDGHPFFSNGVNHATWTGTADRNGGMAYRDAVLAKYGSKEAWAAGQLPRFAAWGINTLGGWSDDDLFAGTDTPYTLLLGFAGQDFVTGRQADFWSPSWASGVQAGAQAAAAAHGNDPDLVGYFTDNELHWAKDWRFRDQFDLYLDRAASSPGKQAQIQFLRARYGDDFASFTTDFSTAATDWSQLTDPAEVIDVGPGAAATRAAWAAIVAERYFEVTDAALTAADPNHLNLGVRFITQLVPPEVVAAAGAHVDVVSVNWYDIKPEWEVTLAGLGPAYTPTADTLAAFHTITDKPLLVSEFGYRAADSGLPNSWPPFMLVLDTQAERAAKYRNYASCLIDTGYVVGAHWFELTDEPAIGRSDNEDSNWGFVTEADDEYPEVTATAKAVHDAAYAPLHDSNWQPLPCDPIGPQPLQPVETTTTTAAPTTSAAPATTQAAVAVTATPSFTG